MFSYYFFTALYNKFFFFGSSYIKISHFFLLFTSTINSKYHRICHGYAYVANNLYQGWVQYAIGGSMGPSLKSEANLFIAPKLGSKEVIKLVKSIFIDLYFINQHICARALHLLIMFSYFLYVCVGDMEER